MQLVPHHRKGSGFIPATRVVHASKAIPQNTGVHLRVSRWSSTHQARVEGKEGEEELKGDGDGRDDAEVHECGDVQHDDRSQEGHGLGDTRESHRGTLAVHGILRGREGGREGERERGMHEWG